MMLSDFFMNFRKMVCGGAYAHTHTIFRFYKD
jgi:hypothetical protein